ncbi:hypothetical protein BH20VER2_BH20VER2_12250 [soil metagenome]
MKILPFSVAMPSLAALSLLCLGVFQACQATGPVEGPPAPDPQGGPDPLVWFSRAPVKIKKGNSLGEKRGKLISALKRGKSSNTEFCRKSNECEPISHPRSTGGSTVAFLVNHVSTENVTTGDDGGTGGTDAIHVAQTVNFDTAPQKQQFVKDLGYE